MVLLWWPAVFCCQHFPRLHKPIHAAGAEGGADATDTIIGTGTIIIATDVAVAAAAGIIMVMATATTVTTTGRITGAMVSSCTLGFRRTWSPSL